jgi:hypothetical protein
VEWKAKTQQQHPHVMARVWGNGKHRKLEFGLGFLTKIFYIEDSGFK